MSRAPRLLVIAPHPDDEVLGAGGTIARFAKKGGEVTILTVAAHMPPLYTQAVHEQTVREAKKAHALMGVRESVFLDKPAVLLGQIPVSEFNGMILDVVKRAQPDVLLVPYYDRHIDHRLIFDACMVAARPVGAGKNIGVVAAYETLSETHWNAPHLEPNFTPSWVVDVTDFIDTKIAAMRCYESQIHPFPEPRSAEALRALALFRGSQAGFGYGEGFHVLRMGLGAESLVA
ncbi:MAG: PIG-L family deacetylase [Myxococcales bacterium]|jgi:LmbE family N-acetylglucosaminyl deacetylase|nr:PIG-L family deacetylase [Myxococcales bacterium]